MRRGFTLVEIMLVVAILVLGAAMVIPKLARVQERTNGYYEPNK